MSLAYQRRLLSAEGEQVARRQSLLSLSCQQVDDRDILAGPLQQRRVRADLLDPRIARVPAQRLKIDERSMVNRSEICPGAS